MSEAHGAQSIITEESSFDRRHWRKILAQVAKSYRGGLRLYASIRRQLVPAAFFEQALALLPEGGKVCDVGCGVGMYTIAMAMMRPDLKFTGLELNMRRVEAAAAAARSLQVANVTFQAADLRDPKFETAFDAVLAIDLLHHLPPRASEALMAVIYGCLNPGGRIVVKEIDVRPWWRWGFTYLLDLAMAPHDDYGYFSLAARRRQLARAGFSRVVGLGLASILPYPHIIIVGDK